MAWSFFSRTFASVLSFAFLSFLALVQAGTISTQATVLIIAADQSTAFEATEAFNGYGIPVYSLLVPSTGTALPPLYSNTSTGAVGNYGAIVVCGQVSYATNGTYGSALTTDQWNDLYNYQVDFNVRMVQLDVYPGPDFGATALGGCCGTGVDQDVYISDDSAFKQAGLTVGSTLSTEGLWHYPSTITDPTTTTEFLGFGRNAQFSTNSTAAVINNFDGRQQMALFISSGISWSQTSNFIAHTWVTWCTRGLYAGYRRVYLNVQTDDMFLETDIYSPNGTTFRVVSADLDSYVTWTPQINAKMPPGSAFFVEVGHNGNGNIEASDDLDDTGKLCAPGPIEYPDQIDTPLEFQKPLGTGTNLWPATPTVYGYTEQCIMKDALMQWWSNPTNRDTFASVTHTFTHEEVDNATYSDVAKEIQFNQAWLNQSLISQAKHVSLSGLIPPAITGLHNGDAIRAWVDNGLWNGVGDNTRPVLLNTENSQWPLITTMAANGYDGFQVTPRWATNIYYNCYSPDCTLLEYKNTNAGVNQSATFSDLLDIERTTNTRHLLGLHHDPFMFHQANMRQSDVAPTNTNGVVGQYSLQQVWVELVTAEMTRLVNWPFISLKHDDIATSFNQRMARDSCNYQLTWLMSTNGTTTTSPASANSTSTAVPNAITGVTLTTGNSNTCPQPIPVTVPGPVTDTQGFQTEQIGNDPLTIWVKMVGGPVTFTLQTPVAM